MNVLITAGSTMTMIDQVRGLTNIFHGTTGRKIAEFLAPHHQVTLVTSGSPKLIDRNFELIDSWEPWERHGLRHSRGFGFGCSVDDVHMKVICFRTFDELAQIMEQEIRTGEYDVIIHSAAVSDFQVESVWKEKNNGRLEQIDASTKISSSHPELYLKLVPTFKIIDKIRSEWGFAGKLVKFKLQVGMADEELIAIAKRSRQTSEADLIVANCLEWSHDYAYIINANDEVVKVTREELPKALWTMLRQAQHDKGE